SVALSRPVYLPIRCEIRACRNAATSLCLSLGRSTCSWILKSSVVSEEALVNFGLRTFTSRDKLKGFNSLSSASCRSFEGSACSKYRSYGNDHKRTSATCGQALSLSATRPG